MAAVSSVSRKGDFSALAEATRKLIKQRVMVGVPDSTAERQPSPGEPNPPSNAVIGYTLEMGDDELHIPARPFLVPGIESVKDDIAAALTVAGVGLLAGDNGAIDRGFAKVGAMAVVAVKQKMQDGPFAPLSDRTIEARARRRDPDTGKLVGAKANRDARNFLKLRAQGTPDDVLHDAGLAQPLIDTRSLFKSITYVVRNKS